MVKILASGEIVPDNDPRAQAATQRNTQSSQAASSVGGSAASVNRAANAGSSQGGNVQNGTNMAEENVLTRDLAKALGIQGRKQVIFGHEVELVYLLVGGLLAVLWLSGGTGSIQMLVMAFVLYVMYSQYKNAQAVSGGGTSGIFGGLGGGGGGGG
eukprot:CAMPEP_0206618592 /NCGR_PEP_ID=MMETSP0325_2-20121206/60351_1 /ASSEMBLY_ACC=CAM_ASM_000347 /TAXON_ID=2866 /ORGANISM="Crypthecodinium cohnii, Strain Seligo" /LENGTH=155 /DNA_ID=CAMNT_0054140853 /DNA_START=96 /DNA_END=560 /DNA_ORIENTATION=+